MLVHETFSIGSVPITKCNDLQLESRTPMGTVETPHHVPGRVPLNHSTNSWVMVTHAFKVIIPKVVLALETWVARPYKPLDLSGDFVLCGFSFGRELVTYLLWARLNAEISSLTDIRTNAGVQTYALMQGFQQHFIFDFSFTLAPSRKSKEN